MVNKDLEKQLSTMRDHKKQLVKEFISKTIAAINLSEIASLKHSEAKFADRDTK